jgi:hypothetical protein
MTSFKSKTGIYLTVFSTSRILRPLFLSYRRFHTVVLQPPRYTSIKPPWAYTDIQQRYQTGTNDEALNDRR